jgi:pSer/pThr/pTyr-binding forkhead associated (FHA) protein
MLEILLVIWAWKRGWKGWALVPMFGCWIFVFILASSGSGFGAILVPVVVEYAILIIMIIARRQPKEDVVAISAEPAPYVPPANNNLPNTGVVAPATVLAPGSQAKLVLPDNREIAINRAVNSIGRQDFGQTLSPEELKYVSRQQMLIRSEGDHYYVEDRNSANHTKVNGLDIRNQGSQEIRDGDRIDVADTLALTFRVCGQA